MDYYYLVGQMSGSRIRSCNASAQHRTAYTQSNCWRKKKKTQKLADRILSAQSLETNNNQNKCQHNASEHRIRVKDRRRDHF